MAVDFFTGCSTKISAEKFGLCDDPPPPHSKAYCKGDSEHTWIATVDNPNKTEVVFTAIDHCTVIMREDDPAKMESLCDCMLTYSDRIVFVELKDSDYKGMFAHAKEQLANTIRLFAASHGLHHYRKRKACISNKSKPKFPYQLIAEMDEFKRLHNVVLTSDTTIKIR